MKNMNYISKGLLVTALLLISFLAKPETGPALGKTEASSQKTIRQLFQFPGLLLPLHEGTGATTKVEVIFTTDEEGCVNFVLARTTDAALKAGIEKRFLSLRLPNLKSDVAHSVVLNFKTI